MHPVDDAVREVRQALSDPARVASALGLSKGMKAQSNGVMVLCPHHHERSPSCSLTVGPDGTLRAKCFGCDWTADAIGLVAEVAGLETRGTGFREAVVEAARVAGLHSLVDALSGGPAPSPPTAPESAAQGNLARGKLKEWVPQDQAKMIWEFATSVALDKEASEYLVCQRRLDPDFMARSNLLRVIPPDMALPPWASYHGKTWAETGHRMICRLFSAEGHFVSLRAWRITSGDSPKRLPPAGHRGTGHVLANRTAVGMLLGKYRPRLLEVTEGEPDWATMCQLTTDMSVAVIGIGSGWWIPEIARRVPSSTRVNVRTHADEAGEKYAAQVASSLERCSVWRVA